MRIGVDLGGTKIEIVALDAAGVQVLRRRVASPAHSYDAIVDTIGALVEGVEAELGARGSVGIGTPGAPSRSTGLMQNANSTVLNKRPLRDDLERRLARPVRIANDANCLTLSEASDGAASGASSVFGVILGTGVGGGIVLDRRLQIGHNAIAGEWGHNPLPWSKPSELPGPSCYCGKAGCIETFLSGPGLLCDYRSSGGELTDVPSMVAAAHSGEPNALAALERYYDRLTRALATIVNVLDPDAIVLGGGLSNIATLYAEIPRRLPAYVFSNSIETSVLPPLHGDSSGVRGAAWLWP